MIASLAIFAVSVSSAIFLILELFSPYTGLIKVSSAPFRAALAVLGKRLKAGVSDYSAFFGRILMSCVLETSVDFSWRD